MIVPDAPEPFRWDVVRDNGSARVVPVGELDLAARAQLDALPFVTSESAD